jgi:hypothetical protein
MAYRKDFIQPQAGGQGFARTMKVFGKVVSFRVADLVTINNVVGCFMVPAGFTLLSGIGTFPDLDTGTTLTLSLGDAAAPARILSASAIGQAGGAFPALAAGAFLYRWNVDTEIIATIAAAAPGGQAGDASIYLSGFMW